MSRFKMPPRWSHGVFFKLPCITARERRLRSMIRWGASVFLVTVPTIVICLAWLRMQPKYVVPIIPLAWLSGISLAIGAVKLSEALMDGKIAGRAANWKFCPKCEYDLTAMPDEGCCPECGEPFTLAELQSIWTQVYERHEEKPGG